MPRSTFGLTWGQHTKRGVRAVEIMPLGICIKTLLYSHGVWREEGYRDVLNVVVDQATKTVPLITVAELMAADQSHRITD